MKARFVNRDQSPKKERSRNRTKSSKIGFVLGAALLAAVTGCVGYVDRPHHGGMEGGVVVQDDYVYYPGYQVYYGSHTGRYVYQDGRSWVSRPAPPHVSVDVLATAPSVWLDFHDHPSIHHETVVRQYPKHWAPPGSGPNRGQGDRDDQGGHR